MNLPLAASTMALPVASLAMEALLFSVRSPVALVKKSPLMVSVPPMVMPALVPLVEAVMEAAVMEGNVSALAEASVTLINGVLPPMAPPKLIVPAVALRL